MNVKLLVHTHHLRYNTFLSLYKISLSYLPFATVSYEFFFWTFQVTWKHQIDRIRLFTHIDETNMIITTNEDTYISTRTHDTWYHHLYFLIYVRPSRLALLFSILIMRLWKYIVNGTRFICWVSVVILSLMSKSAGRPTHSSSIFLLETASLEQISFVLRADNCAN